MKRNAADGLFAKSSILALKVYMGKTAKRIVAWGQIFFILCCICYSTYSFFIGNFEQAFLPYPILIIYYLLFLRRTRKKEHSEESNLNVC